MGNFVDTEDEWGFLASYINVSLNGTEIGTTEMNAVPYALSSGDRKWFSSSSNDDIFRYDGNVGIGTDDPEERLHIEGGAYINSGLGRLKIGEDDNGDQWHLATLNSAQDLLFLSKPNGNNIATARLSLKQNGRVGIGNSNPDEELVIGENLGFGWAIPAATIGDSDGGAIQVGNPTTSFAIDAGSAFDRTRFIATDFNGFGQGTIEMRTRQLNIGTEPGVATNPYAVRIVQPSAYGLNLVSHSNPASNWELLTASTGELFLISEEGFVGNFDATSGNYSATSDRRLKTNISNAQTVLDKVVSLDAKSYNYKTNLDKKYIGFVAQDLKEVFPEIVTEAEDRTGQGESTLMVDYNQLNVIALKAIKEQQLVIEVLKARIEVLENN